MTVRISGLNHLTLAVADLDRSLAFYRDLLGCVLRARWATGAYLEAGPLWLCLSVGVVSPREDYTHAAFSVTQDDFAVLSERVRAACMLWQENASEGQSMYMLDPDGHRLELHVGSLASRLDDYEAQGRTDVDIDRGGATASSPAHPDPTGALIASWDANAAGWTDAVRSGAIASRRLATDDAVLKAVLRHQPRRVLDLGCGEGWLSRALAEEVEHVVGLDVSHDLVDQARAAGGGVFHQTSYAGLVAEPARFGCDFDVIVANFALLDEALEPLLSAVSSITRPGGALVIQTLHPATQPPPYEDGWRQENFSGFAGERWTPMPWYFRTLGSWLHDVGRCWRVTAVTEPVNPITGMPASLLIEALR